MRTASESGGKQETKRGDEGVEGIVENTEKEGWGNKGRAFIPYVIKHMWWMQYNRRHCRLTLPFS